MKSFRHVGFSAMQEWTLPQTEWENIYPMSPNASLCLDGPPRPFIILPKLSPLRKIEMCREENIPRQLLPQTIKIF
jgi:hypothetical protein